MPRISGLLMSDHGVWAARLCSDPINGWGWRLIGRQATSDVRRQWDMAMNYWLPDNRVLKIDLQRQDKETGKKSGWLLCRSG